MRSGVRDARLEEIVLRQIATGSAAVEVTDVSIQLGTASSVGAIGSASGHSE